MKCMCTVFAMLLIFISVMAPTVANETDWMPDANLRTAVRSALALDAGDTLTTADMEDLTSFTARNSEISNITGLDHATNLETLDLRDNTISNISALSGLTSLETLRLKGNNIDNISALSELTHLTLLNLRQTGISSVSALSGLTNLAHLRLDGNGITDVQPLTSLVNLEKLWIAGNSLTNAHLLSSLTNLTTLDIEIPDPPDTTDPDVEISVPSGTQIGAFDVTITFTGAVSDFVQADLSLGGTATASITDWDTTDDTVFTAEITPTTSGEVTLDIAEDVAIDAANNGNTAATVQTVSIDVDRPGVTIAVNSYTKSGYGAPISPVVDVRPIVTVTFTEPVRRDEFDPRSELTFSGTTITIKIAGPMGDQCSEVTVDEQTIRLCGQWVYDLTATESGELTFNVAEGVTRDLAGNSNTAATLTVTADIDPPAISRVTVPAGTQGSAFNMTIEFTEPVSPGGAFFVHNSYLSSSDLTISRTTGLSYSAIFQVEEVDRTTYILTLTPDDGRWSMDGQIRITAISSDSVKDAARNLNLQQSLSESVSPYVSISTYSPYDMDKDDDVDIYDVKIVLQAIGQSGGSITDPRTDIDADGDVDKDDALAVIDDIDDGAGAPPSTDIFADLSPEIYKALDPILLTETLDAVRLESDGSLKYLQAIVLLEHLLAEMRPDETQLLANYPNPFNPETWIPYQLAKSSDVRITIYDVRGRVIRRLELGHLPSGYYTSRNRAAYWDGRNTVGERVASGIYFYQFQADNRSFLRKMLILK